MSELPKELKCYFRHCQSLQRLLRDTNSSLDDINDLFQLGRDVKRELLICDALEVLSRNVKKIPNLIVFGQSCHAKALFVNRLLQQVVLPYFSNQWRHITFMYGPTKSIYLTLEHEIEIVEKLNAHQDSSWVTIPEEDLKRNDTENLLDHCPSVEVVLKNKILKENFNISIPPDCQLEQLVEIISNRIEKVLPVIVYVVSEDTLSDANIQEIRKLKDIYSVPFLFVSVSSGTRVAEAMLADSTESLTESEKHLVESQRSENHLHSLREQLTRLGFLNSNQEKESDKILRKKSFCMECSLDNAVMCYKSINKDFVPFIKDLLKSKVLQMAKSISEIHNSCLKKFILCAFDMAREIQITPRRILYAQEIELKMYKDLMKITTEEQEKIMNIIQKNLQDMKSNVAEVLEGYNSSNTGQLQVSPKVATMEIQQLVLQRLRTAVATQLVQSVGCLQESFTGTLQRCLESLEKNCHDLENNLSASDAVKQIIHAAYNVDLKTPTSFSIIHNFMDRLRKLLGSLTSPWSSNSQFQCTLQWQLQVVTNIIDSLSASKLAKTISTQFQEHVKSSHETFLSAMRSLDNQLSGHLEHTEEQRIAIRKKHAPKLAKLALESTSMCDLVRWGRPKLIREIGRGQYGVVSSCEPWGGVDPCAIKSVVPPDDRHWTDLAMEFYYTRTIPEHPRIVKLRGSVIDYTYGGGSSPAVLLIMERMPRDLYCGLKTGLSWIKRLRIAIDVIEGIRYLHSQGLVHRDIKLKNVLLDNEDRAKLTDFGFCIPEAMMSGSIVGTPVHMAPELHSRRYDSSVDVYAFGILFWYICAGKVRLPTQFDQFQNKEQLWSNVRKGIRPECLPHFNQACWNLMEQCWAAEPSERPLLGHVQPQLEQIYNNAKLEANQDALSEEDVKLGYQQFNLCKNQI
ncbi:dual serine/threonine and tyrosine protein kinase-like isoform X2 [Anthonomus grandis grandis]|uniref:dual serine/threonine and tyrosine protein kinase-like isoform X2 n=1 Tax=Anthonomus grandis grandis TaxID=2921223 RepID=UPI0021659C08|nr:dual serine/threonine and tyrosine protein kinase-like isoform X2 [Anthonomus grandis grandis]